MTNATISKNQTPGIARRAVAAGLALALACGLAGCGGTRNVATTTETEAQAEDTVATTSGSIDIHYLDTTDLFSDRDVAGTYDEASATTISLVDAGSTVEGAGATVDGDVVTIAEEGTYVTSGTLSDGRLVVDAADDAKVQIVLDGARVTSSDGAALYVVSADKVFVTLAADSESALATSGAYAQTDEGVDGAIYAKDDLVVNGQGVLSVTSAEGHGIVGKDDVKLCLSQGGTLTVEAAKSAVNANDSVRVTGEGAYTLVAGTDGVHVENSDDAEKGYVYVAGGAFDVTAGSDGFDASYIMQVDGGAIVVEAGDDGLHAEADLVITDGTIDVIKSYEGLEGARIGIDGGDVKVTSSDDGLNAVGDDGTNTTGDVTLDDLAAMGDDETSGGGTAAAMGGDGAPEPPDGLDGATPAGEPPARPEGGMGMEPPTGVGVGPGATAASTTDADATTRSAAGGGQFGGRGGNGGMGGGMMDADDSALIAITGGTLHVDANGDGIDSNGKIVMTGGEVQVDGPVNTGNGALDCGTEITISGGTLLATSAGGMEENATSGTTQPTFLVSLGSNATGTVTVSDARGNEVASWSSAKQFNAVLVSSPSLSVGETYTVTCDGASATVTLDDTVTGEGAGMMGGFSGGMRGAPDGMGADGDRNADSNATDNGAAAPGERGDGGMRGPGGMRGRGGLDATNETDGEAPDVTDGRVGPGGRHGSDGLDSSDAVTA